MIITNITLNIRNKLKLGVKNIGRHGKMRQSIRLGGRGTGRPLDQFKYGKRTCHYVIDYKTRKEADSKANQLEKQGILTVVRKWYSKYVVYRCGMRKK